MLTDFTVTYDGVKCIRHGDSWLESSYNFVVTIFCSDHLMEYHASNELVRDLSVIMGLDPVRELENISRVEIAEEKRQLLLQMVSDFASKGKNDKNLKNFRTSINEARSTRDLDKIAAQLALFPADRVVK